MSSFRPVFFFSLLILTAAITLACGSSLEHLLQSVSVSPATADAKDYPEGLVPFTATGYFNTNTVAGDAVGGNLGSLCRPEQTDHCDYGQQQRRGEVHAWGGRDLYRLGGKQSKQPGGLPNRDSVRPALWFLLGHSTADMSVKKFH